MRLSLLGLVIAVIATLAPSWALAGNQEVAQEVAQEIANQLKVSGKLNDYKINIKYENGAAWLTGRVNSQQQRTSAEIIARTVSGVKEVHNELQVFPSSAAARGAVVRPAQFTQAPRVPAPQLQDPNVEQAIPQAPVAHPQQAPQLSQAQMLQMQQQMAQQMQQMQQMQMQQQQQHQQVAMRSYPNRNMKQGQGAPMPSYVPSTGAVAPVRYDQPNMPNYAWPSYASHPNYAAVTYPRQYSATAWPFIGPFYPYPQVPLGWRKVTLEWDDGWWFLDFDDR